VDLSYIWGEAAAVWASLDADVGIANLETAVTASDDWQPKGINYRMHPANAPCLQTARIDCYTLANNHVLDWGPAGLLETLSVLTRLRLRMTGAGAQATAAAAPALLPVAGKGRVVVFAGGLASSGIPPAWAATANRAGINFLPDLSTRTVADIAAQVNAVRAPGDLVVYSVHWGDNWGYAVPAEQQHFAHALVDDADVDVVHGHSSHHGKGIEVYRGKPIFYGCGDFINDYEGISGYEDYRGDLSAMYFPTFDANRRLLSCTLVPLQMRNFRLNAATTADVEWLAERLTRAGNAFDTALHPTRDQRLQLLW
jgi:poly-gamma-glutamate synthesis protein (capsule biosynthesis protein)